MGRYKIVKEVNKVGRRVEVQYAVVDSLDQRVVVRYAKEEDADSLIRRFEEAVQATED